MRNIVLTILVAFFAGFGGAFFYSKLYIDLPRNEIVSDSVNYALVNASTNNDAYDSKNSSAIISRNDVASIPIDFVEASEKSTSSVVFIQTVSEVEYSQGHWMDWFFEPRAYQRSSSGSGVIFSNDGYIVTNNHVIDGANVISVIHGKKTYKAELIGTDPSTDLAVIKIEADQMPAVALGRSADVRVGEWVLAVGNPFNLTSTVTAGIVSAKGRNINILKDKFPIESFIQTDAAINPGNSGGALVNSKGELIGINTAILSKTGSYTGYGFAVPVDIVFKVYNDLKNYGEVQKAFLGADYMDVDSELKKRLNLEAIEGVVVIDVREGWAADKASIKKGDIILSANGTPIDNKASLEERLGYLAPGDELQLLIKREGKVLNKKVSLTNREGTIDIIRKTLFVSEKLGVTFESVPKLEREMLGITNGVRVVSIGNGFFKRLDIPEGFIVTQINKVDIESPEELSEVLEKIRGRVIISGIDNRGRRVYYPFMF